MGDQDRCARLRNSSGELVSIRHCPRHLRTALDCSRPGQLVELLA